ncbi:MAG: hypothetical protein LBK70_00045 [Clostridiales bacterium]|jgi:hypothetical protein|nr:hypothetical protein [Clostridiales bacterium]
MTTSILSNIIVHGTQVLMPLAFGLIATLALVLSIIIAVVIRRVANHNRQLSENQRQVVNSINKKLSKYEFVIRFIFVVALLVVLVVISIVDSDNVVWVLLPAIVLLVISWSYELAKNHYIKSEILKDIN